MGFLDDLTDEFDNLAPSLGSPIGHVDPTGPDVTDTGVFVPPLASTETPGDWTDDPLGAAGDLVDLAIDSVDLPRVELADGHLEVDVMFGGVDTHLSADRDGYEFRTDTLGVGIDAGATFGQEMHVGVHGGGESTGLQMDIPDVHGWDGDVDPSLTHGGLPDYTDDGAPASYDDFSGDS